MIEDELLKWKFKSGNSDALRRIYEKYTDFLLTLAIALLNDINEAEDVLHDCFVSFAESAATFRIRGSLKGYLATCVVNRARDRLRNRGRRPAALDLEGIEPAAVDVDEPVKKICCDESTLRLNCAINELPSEQKEVVLMHVKAKMKFRQIAKLQNVSVSTVQGRYRYGIKRLRSILDGEVPK